jgi:hypothetical protein
MDLLIETCILDKVLLEIYYILASLSVLQIPDWKNDRILVPNK